MIKIKNTETIDGKTVCKGKLVLVDTNERPIKRGQLIKFIGSNYNPFKRDVGELAICEFPDADINIDAWIVIKPIIISETEEKFIGDKAFHRHPKIANDFRIIDVNESNCFSIQEHWVKILALPERFSPAILNQIVNGELKDGSELWIECEDKGGYRDDSMNGCWISKIVIKLKQQNHINIIEFDKRKEALNNIKEFVKSTSSEEIIRRLDDIEKPKIKAKYITWKDIIDKYRSYKIVQMNLGANTVYTFDAWLEKNYNPPIEKP